MTIPARSDLIAALTRGDGDALMGTAEASWLDFKQQPYILSQRDQPLELAKDVSALANSGGGILLIGVTTTRDTGTAQDLASSWKRVPCSLIDTEKYRATVARWTYPPVHGLTFRWWMLEGNEGDEAGLLTIEVPATLVADSPTLVASSIEESSQSGILLGLFHRPGDTVVVMRPGQVHTLIQLGRHVQRGGLMLGNAIPAAPGGPSDQERQERLNTDASELGMQDERRYFLQAWPLQSVEVRQLHNRSDEGFRSILSWPRVIRSDGFGFRTGASAETISGGGVRVLNPPRWSVSLLLDGLLTIVVTAGPEFLAWADQARGQPLSINSIALVEMTLEFVRLFVNYVLPTCEPTPTDWAISGGMASLTSEQSSSRLAPGTPAQSIYGEPQPASSDGFSFGPLRQHKTAAGVVAFEVLKRVYQHFGLSTSAIPFVREGAIDEQLIGSIDPRG